jgi:hypothetical protein
MVALVHRPKIQTHVTQRTQLISFLDPNLDTDTAGLDRDIAERDFGNAAVFIFVNKGTLNGNELGLLVASNLPDSYPPSKRSSLV